MKVALPRSLSCNIYSVWVQHVCVRLLARSWVCVWVDAHGRSLLHRQPSHFQTIWDRVRSQGRCAPTKLSTRAVLTLPWADKSEQSRDPFVTAAATWTLAVTPFWVKLALFFPERDKFSTSPLSALSRHLLSRPALSFLPKSSFLPFSQPSPLSSLVCPTLWWNKFRLDPKLHHGRNSSAYPVCACVSVCLCVWGIFFFAYVTSFPRLLTGWWWWWVLNQLKTVKKKNILSSFHIYANKNLIGMSCQWVELYRKFTLKTN